jgi:hypothetical protein
MSAAEDRSPPDTSLSRDTLEPRRGRDQSGRTGGRSSPAGSRPARGISRSTRWSAQASSADTTSSMHTTSSATTRGPFSLAYLWVAPDHRSRAPIEHNWINRAGSENFARLTDYQDDFRPRPADARSRHPCSRDGSAPQILAENNGLRGRPRPNRTARRTAPRPRAISSASSTRSPAPSTPDQWRRADPTQPTRRTRGRPAGGRFRAPARWVAAWAVGVAQGKVSERRNIRSRRPATQARPSRGADAE